MGQTQEADSLSSLAAAAINIVKKVGSGKRGASQSTSSSSSNNATSREELEEDDLVEHVNSGYSNDRKKKERNANGGYSRKAMSSFGKSAASLMSKIVDSNSKQRENSKSQKCQSQARSRNMSSQGLLAMYILGDRLSRRS